MRAGCAALVLMLAPLVAGAQVPRISPDGDWRVVELLGNPVVPGDGPEMTFAKGHVSGLAGCNRFFGSYTLMPGFALSGLGMTRMACLGPAAEREAALTAALSQVNDWRLEGDEVLELLSGDRPLIRAVLVP